MIIPTIIPIILYITTIRYFIIQIKCYREEYFMFIFIMDWTIIFN
jgi:hypothetical protein